MISGALLLDPNKQEDLQTFYRKRLSKIFIPIVVWSTIFLALTYYKSIENNNELTLINLLKLSLSGKPYYHMWFLYMILSLYIFTPFFRKIVAHSSCKELFYLISIIFIFSIVNFAYSKISYQETKLFINLFLIYIPFFFLGYYIRSDKHHPSKVFLWIIFLISFILTFVGCYIVAINVNLASGLYFYGNLSITVIPMSISIMYILKEYNNKYLHYKIYYKTHTWDLPGSSFNIRGIQTHIIWSYEFPSCFICTNYRFYYFYYIDRYYTNNI